MYRATYGCVKGAVKGPCDLDFRLGPPDCKPSRSKAACRPKPECTKLTAELGRVGRSRVLGKGFAFEIDRQCAPETAPEIAALASRGGARGGHLGWTKQHENVVRPRGGGYKATRVQKQQQQKFCFKVAQLEHYYLSSDYLSHSSCLRNIWH